MASVSARIQTQVPHTTSVTQPLVSYSIESTYSHQNTNLGSANTMSTTQSNMGSHVTYFTVPSRTHNT